MRKPVMSALAAALCLALAGATALADTDKDKDRCGDRGRWGERMMEKLDKDKDGRITKQEFEAAHEARMKDRFAKMDVNKDGHVTLDEYQASRGGFGNRFFERLDRNGDGIIDRKEVETPPFDRHGDKESRWRDRAADRDS